VIVLGIDPGTSRTGFGVIEMVGPRLRLVEAGLIRPSPARDLAGRIRDLCGALDGLLDRRRPQEVALEGLFTARNVRSTLVLAHLRGAYLLTLARSGIPIAEYAPRTVKQGITGHGGATKEQVRDMVLRLLGAGAGAGPGIPLDASDALAVAICHAHSRTGLERRRRQGLA